MDSTPDERCRLTVTAGEARRRLDQFLAARLPTHSRSSLQRLIREGQVVLVEQPAVSPQARGAAPPQSGLLRAGRQMAEGEVVEISFPSPIPSGLIPEEVPLSVLHEDSSMLVIDKPAGMVVHPGAGARSGTLVHALLHHCSDLSGIGGVERPGIVHRLDKGTSGVLVVAKTDAAHRDLSRQFQSRSVHKVYMALVWGRPARPSGAIDLPIGRDTLRRVKISARTTSPRDAYTEYRVLESLQGFSWLEVRPRTGRTHQIRVHLKHLGHPIVGDTVYGGARWTQAASAAHKAALAEFGRLALHAHRLELLHPLTGQTMAFEAPVPKEFASLIEVLRRA